MTINSDTYKTSWSDLLYKIDDLSQDIILSAENASDKRYGHSPVFMHNKSPFYIEI
jgi:hypothetical protein